MALALAASCLATAAVGAPASKAHRPIPRSNPGEWFASADYPVSARIREQSGRTGFIVTVDTDGFVQGCTISSASGIAALDDATCALARLRGHFLPATDEAGKPVVGDWTSQITWRLPGDDDGHGLPGEAEELAEIDRMDKETERLMRDFDGFSSETRFTVQEDGRMTDCEQHFTGAVASRFTPFRCKDMPQVGEPILDEEGKPVARRVTMQFGISVDPVKAEAGNADE